MTQPTVGRMVHFYSEAVANRDARQPGYGYNGMGAGPYPAVVTQVFTDGDRVTYINLKVFPPFTPPFDEGSVSEGAAACPGRYWEWPSRAEASPEQSPAEPLQVDGFPRRNRVDYWSPAERAISDAMRAVEDSGASLKLTEAVNLLAKAQACVADHIESQPDPLRFKAEAA